MSGKRRLLRWWLIVALLLLAWLGWRARDVDVELPVINRTASPVALDFYGAGLARPVRIVLEPNARQLLRLTVAAEDEVRIAVVTRYVRNDSRLLNDARLLLRSPQQFEIRSNGEFVLVGAGQ